MSLFLILAYLFYIGASAGWIIEVIFRRFFSRNNPEHKWINPGFCVGPYIPLYGFGLCIMYLLSSCPLPETISSAWQQVIILVCMALAMTAIEYIAGIMALKIGKVRLWDYSGAWGNIQGLICPQFSLIWAAAGAAYYYFIHPFILDALNWLAHNLAFSFVIGFFFGVFTIDVCYSAKLLHKIKKFATENGIVVRYEQLKTHIHQRQEALREKASFLFSFRSSRDLVELLREAQETWERRIHQ